ncbi:MAG: methyltransferase [Fulvimarina manganoxydans]|uniref:class I SAM-dependent methyltransferase n=1 Tax=Fulvimarina manganoxydans TaxID=937218 RepID=UPI0023528CC5|nr:50S ribosomal protein L11 methyltransferase [Fulvimarina manganoxydans]MCK5931764.1 methyltransferase [Fulvimarina manganoxydans]
MRWTDAARAAFILDNTAPEPVAFVEEVRLHLASDVHALWHKTQDDLDALDLAPPFWAFPWGGGQGLARFILDRPDIVAERLVTDFASASGLVAIAAAMAGASHVTAADIDPWARSASKLNADLNAVRIASEGNDIVGRTLETDILLAGDVFYDRNMADRLGPWFDRLTAEGIEILIGDPFRSYLPRESVRQITSYNVPVSKEIEGITLRECGVFQWKAPTT